VNGLIFSLSFLFLSSCSDPPGWTLWRHTFSSNDAVVQQDDWSSYASYSNLGDCKNQISLEVPKLVKIYEKDFREVEKQGYKVDIRKEQNALRVTVVAPPKEKDNSQALVTRFFCVPLGVDPRPKDQSSWVLWEEEFVDSSSRIGPLHSWKPKEGYLSKAACEREKWSNDSRAVREQNKDKKTVVHDYYQCLPAGVSPWGKEEQ
jgi:hypothetical protein